MAPAGGAAAARDAPGLAVGIDAGGTKLAAGLVSASGEVVERVREQTPHGGGDELVSAVARLVGGLAGGAGAAPVGVGVAGVVDRSGVVRFAPNLPDLSEYPLARRLAEAVGVPVVVDNDANVAAWGEYAAGAARDVAGTVAVLTIGTGIGGGLVVDGKLVRGEQGMAAEFGHVIVSEGGPVCGCGNLGCLEAVASGTAIGRTAAELLAGGEAPADTVLRGADDLSGKAVTRAAQAGDAFAAHVLARCGFWLGVGLASIVNALDPHMVVVGGGAMQAGDLLLGPAVRSYTDRLVGRGHRTPAPVVPAALGDDAGLVGAALLARDQSPRP